MVKINIEMPKDCASCPLSNEDVVGINPCFAAYGVPIHYKEAEERGKRPSFCSLYE